MPARFSGVSARIESGIGAVRSGEPMPTQALDGARHCRLVVESPFGAVATRELALDVTSCDRWVTIPGPQLTHRASAAAGVRSVPLVGGSRLDGVRSDAIDRFDSATRQFTRIGTLSSGRADHRRVAVDQTTAPSLKMGRYIDTTMPPISTPRMTMMNGSIRLDRPLTISSTSSS